MTNMNFFKKKSKYQICIKEKDGNLKKMVISEEII